MRYQEIIGVLADVYIYGSPKLGANQCDTRRCGDVFLHYFFYNFSVNWCYILWWRRGVAVERRIRDREVAGSDLSRALRRKNSGQVSHTYG